MRLTLPLYCFIAFFLMQLNAVAQTDTAQKPRATSASKSILKDTLDGNLDFSRFLIEDPSGFIPVPFIITEPALGGFGLAVVPMFLTPKKRPPGFKGYMPPDITAGFGLYTTNKSW